MRRIDGLSAGILAGVLLACQGCSSGRGDSLDPPEDELWLDVHPVEQGGSRVAVAEVRDIPRHVAGAGRIAFDDLHVAHVLPPVTGRVARVLAQTGDRVHPGSPLAVVLSPDLGLASSDAVKARADLAAAATDLDRQRRLAAVSAASQRDVEAAEDVHHRALAEQARASEKARLLGRGGAAGVTQAYTVRSPIDGEVISRNVSPGLEVQGQYSGGQPAELFTVGDVRRVWAFADLSDADLPAVALGAAVTVRVVAYPDRTFPGRVEWISATLDPQLRTARIRAALANDDEALKPEMYAQVSIAAAPRRALAVPRSAVVAIAGQSFAWVAAGRAADGRTRFRRRLLRVAEAGDGWAEVQDGLAAGEEVLVEPPPPGEVRSGQALLSREQIRRAGIRVEPAAERDLPDALELGGRVAFDDLRVTHVFSPVTGRITRVLAAPGTRVRRGAPLATIESPEVGSALADVRKAEADLAQAEHERRRQEELVGAHAGARRDLEAAESAWKKARAEVDRARQRTELLRAGAAGGSSQELVLRSPIDGEVIARNVNPGVEVQGQYSGGAPAVELFTIGDDSRLWVLADAYEQDLPRIRKGDAVELRVSSRPDDTLRGTVDWVSNVLDPQLRTAKVRCLVDNRDHRLRPEMYEGVTLAVPREKVIAVPRSAVLRVGDRRVVFVAKGTVAGGRIAFEPRAVVAEEGRAEGLVPVSSGLAAGEEIVTQGAVFVLGAL